MSSVLQIKDREAVPSAPIVPWSFELGRVDGLSAHTLEIHLGLYATYVKEANLLAEQLHEFPRNHALSAAERMQRDGLVRRLAFERNGVNLHESFFESLGGPGARLVPGGVFAESVTSSFGSFELWRADVCELALTRGVGWVATFRSAADNRLTNVWIDDHTRGVLLELSLVAVFDLWEHAFMFDFKASQRGQYIDVLFNNMNWDVIEQRCAR